jgi:outer membrane lipase/esterase
MNDALSLRLAGENDVKTFDFFGLAMSINANPGAYGLTNVTDAVGAIPGADPATYLYWDGIHPTSTGHTIIAQSLYGVVVPEPSGSVIVAASLLSIVTALRRRSKHLPVVSG